MFVSGWSMPRRAGDSGRYRPSHGCGHGVIIDPPRLPWVPAPVFGVSGVAFYGRHIGDVHTEGVGGEPQPRRSAAGADQLIAE
jgi:hypothetical protein